MKAAAVVACACIGGCVTPPAPAPSEKRPVERTQVLRDDSLGYSLLVPASARLLPTDGPDDVVAASPEGLMLRVVHEHFAGEPAEAACWERLFARLPHSFAERPQTPEELAEKGPAGLTRETGNRLALLARARGSECVVLLVEGTRESPVFDLVAASAAHTFEVHPPDADTRLRLDMEAAGEILSVGAYTEALRRFEAVLETDPEQVRAHLGAGLAAFFLGDDGAHQAISHLEEAIRLRDVEQTQRGVTLLEGPQLRDALMYLGLAYATQKDYVRGEARLAELAARFPDDATGLYNFACVLSLRGDADGSLIQLRRSFELDRSLVDHARTDSDLNLLHARPEWRQLVPPMSGDAARGD